MRASPTQSRERESRGSKTLWRSQGAAPLGFPQSARGHSVKMRSTESRERESRGSKTLWRSQGAAPLGFPQLARGHSVKMRSTESRERESRGSKTLWKQFCQGKIHHFFNLIWRFCDNNPNCIHQVFMYLVSAILYEESAQKIICNHSWQIIICRIDYFYQPVNLLRHSFFYNVPYCSCISRGLVKQMNKDDATLPEVDFKANPTEKAPMALR